MQSSYYYPPGQASKKTPVLKKPNPVLLKCLHYLTENGDKNIQVGVEYENSNFGVFVYLVCMKFESKKIKLDYHQWTSLKLQLPKIMNYFKTGDQFDGPFGISFKEMFNSKTVIISFEESYLAMKEKAWYKLYLLSSVIDEQIECLQEKNAEFNRSYFYLSELICDMLRKEPNLSEVQIQENVAQVARNVSSMDVEILIHFTPELMNE